MNVIVSLDEFGQRIDVGLRHISHERDNVVVVCLVVLDVLDKSVPV